MNSVFLNEHYSLEEKEHLLETVFKNLADLVFVFDLEQHRIVIRNPALDTLLGFSHLSMSHIETADFIDIIHPEDQKLIFDAFEEIGNLTAQSKLSIEMRIRNAQGTYTFYQFWVTVFKQNGNGANQVLCIAQDMSEKIKYEMHKQRSINTLKELSFITSHELRHEYAKIQSIIQLIDNQFIDEKERQILLLEAKQSIQIINSTIFKINHKLSFNQNDSFFESTGVVAKYKKVLLVDDDALTNMLNKKIIQVAIKEMPIEIFTNTEDALKYLSVHDKQGDFLIFLDINFPEKNGWDFLDTYIDFDKKSKVIMLSSSIDNEDRDRARSYEMVIDYITKPLSIDFVEGILKA
ncbi:MAG: response regulator [Chitinophagaceae bacterium]|nr:response regulator [Chitinophagaceae bacterium]